MGKSKKYILLPVISISLMMTMTACTSESDDVTTSSSVDSVTVSSSESVFVSSLSETVSTSSETGQMSAAASTELKTIGTVADGENVQVVNLTNSTGKAIKGFAVKYDAQEDFGDNMLADGDVFANGEERNVYYDTTEAIEAASADVSAESAETDPSYTVLLTFEDDSTAEVHNFPFEDSKDLTLLTDGTIYYIEYTKDSTGESLSTQQDELTIYDAAKAAEAAEAEAAQESYNSDSGNSGESESGGTTDSGTTDTGTTDSGITDSGTTDTGTTDTGTTDSGTTDTGTTDSGTTDSGTTDTGTTNTGTTDTGTTTDPNSGCLDNPVTY